MKEIKDSKGNKLKVGDKVRILALPDLTGMSPDARSETLPVFKRALGTYRRIEGFSSQGLIELIIRIKITNGWSTDFIFIEPRLVAKLKK
jgi:hypothetical protein